VLHPPIVEEEDADSKQSVSHFEHIRGAQQRLEQGATFIQQHQHNGETLVDIDPASGPVIKEVKLDVTDSEGESEGEGDAELNRDSNGAAGPGVRRRRTIRVIIRSRAFL
jgi:hypothetical protein